MTFTDYAKSLKNEKNEFIKTLSELTLANPTTVARWMNGEFLPSKVRRGIISRELKIPEEQLFPDKND